MKMFTLSFFGHRVVIFVRTALILSMAYGSQISHQQNMLLSVSKTEPSNRC